MPKNPLFPQTPRWLSRIRLTTGAAGLAAAALSLAACGPGKVNTSIKRERAEVQRETGELPPAGTAKRLEREQSVFLRRHANDPVDWYPWGEEAFAKARAEGRLVLVSIGYASCPWSQRMQDETFSDPVTARFMNRHFVNVLVDCGERTEVNNIYINFLFWKSRQSGWPLHLWLTPEGLPVFSGNYFPAKSSGNQASWNPIIEHIQNSYADDPAHVQGKALEVVREYGREYRKLWKSTGAPPVPAAQAACFDRLRSMFDPVHGGFTQAPKFALPYALEFLLNYTARLGEDRVGRKKEAENMLGVSLSNLVRGGIHDQLGGGFHRYSMDIYWAVPQFEKMLYDQGTLAGVLAEAAVTLNRPEYLETVRDVLGYTDRELGQPDGGFSGAQSSSSPAAGGSGELVEGSYYQWTWEEMEKVAGTAAMPLLRAVYDVDDQGNIPIDSPAYSRMRKVNVLRIVRPLEEAAESLKTDPATARRTLDTARAALLEARTKRPRPLLDNAVITSWNGAAISGFARAGWVLNDPALTERAGKAADFVLGKLRQPDGALVHAWLDAPSAAPAGSEDYAMMIRGLLDLYEATGTAKWLKEAAALQDKQNGLLWDPQDGGFFDSAQQPFLFNRMKSADESTEFAPAAICTVNQARLGWLLNRTEDLAKARTALNTCGSLANNAPATFLRLLLAADLVQRPPLQIVITGAPDAPDRAALLAALRQRPSAGTVRLYLDGGEGGKLLTAGQPSLEKLTSPSGRTTLHFCRNFELLHSITDPAQVKPWMEAQALASP